MLELTQTSLQSSKSPIGATNRECHSEKTNKQSPTVSTTLPFPRWAFTEKELKNSPSVRAGYSIEKEESYRQEMCNFIQVRLCSFTAFVFVFI